MKITSGREAVEMGGTPLLPFFLITAILISSYVFRFGLGYLGLNRLLDSLAFRLVELAERSTEPLARHGITVR